MHLPGFWSMLLIVGVGIILFGGGGKISGIMGDFAKGIKAFKKGMAEDDDVAAKPAEAPKAIDQREKV
jgi:sec-independent protein translocase protein TatA